MPSLCERAENQLEKIFSKVRFSGEGLSLSTDIVKRLRKAYHYHLTLIDLYEKIMGYFMLVR